MSELKDYYPEHEIKSLAYISINYLLNMSKSDTIINANKIIGVSVLQNFFSTISDLKKYSPFNIFFLKQIFIIINFFVQINL